MAAEIISEIKKVEQEAKELIANANKTSKDILAKASIDAQAEYDSILNEARIQIKTIIDNAVLEANNEASVLQEKGQAECELISKPSNEKFDEAVNLVIERIVNIHGNS
ncbi:MAG: ATPase [Sarcina sp.]